MLHARGWVEAIVLRNSLEGHPIRTDRRWGPSVQVGPASVQRMTGISHTFLSTSYSSAPTCTVIRFFPRQNIFPVISSKIRQSNKASNEQAFSFIRLYTKTVPFPSTQKYRYPVTTFPSSTRHSVAIVCSRQELSALKCTSARLRLDS